MLKVKDCPEHQASAVAHAKLFEDDPYSLLISDPEFEAYEKAAAERCLNMSVADFDRLGKANADQRENLWSHEGLAPVAAGT